MHWHAALALLVHYKNMQHAITKLEQPRMLERDQRYWKPIAKLHALS